MTIIQNSAFKLQKEEIEQNYSMSKITLPFLHFPFKIIDKTSFFIVVHYTSTFKAFWPAASWARLKGIKQ